MNAIWSDVTWFLGFFPNLLAAVVCGYLVGIERKIQRHPIGVTTCTLVCLGATSYMGSGHLILETAGATGDPARVASQIVTGIGFLGAGAILRGPTGVTGLT